MKKTTTNNNNNDDNDAFSLPLLDEVNELITKEKILLELKILEQKNEASQWKKRYEALLGQVADTANDTGDLAPLQNAANNTTTINNNNLNYDNNDPIDNILLSLSPNEWMIDLSNQPLSSSILTRLCKGSSAITYTNPLLSVFNLSHCSIKDDHANILAVLLSNPNVKAIDLSNNSLGIIIITIIIIIIIIITIIIIAIITTNTTTTRSNIRVISNRSSQSP